MTNETSQQPLTDTQLDSYAELAITADHEGLKVDPAVVTVLVDEVRRLQFQRRYLLGQLAKKDARSGEADRKLREFLAGPDGGEMAERLTGTRPCGHDDYHDPHEWADRPGVWCPGHSLDEPASA